MGKPAARKGDKCTGHGDAKPRACDQGSPDVFYNGKPAHRKGDHWKKHKSHDSKLQKGSNTVFTNGRQQGRKTDPVICGSKVAQGSPDIFIGDSASESTAEEATATSAAGGTAGGAGRFAAAGGYSGAGTISDESDVDDDGQEEDIEDVPIDDATEIDWLTTCMMDEALNQRTPDAWAAVAQCVMNRVALHYGGNPVNDPWKWTIKGIVLAKNAFSGFYFEMRNGKYTRVVSSFTNAEKRGLKKMAKYRAMSAWKKFHAVAEQVAAGTYRGGSSWQAIKNRRATLYYNPRISSPAWARTTSRVCQIEDHAYYKD
jgi:uncharacterized Zn-binding protein involved in type VI secretion